MIDLLLQKTISRKLAVWAAASGFLTLGLIDGTAWVTLSVIYLGSQTALDSIAASRYKKELEKASS